VAAGRVQLLLVNDAFSQARALVAELQRLRSLKPDLQWTDCAVLARTRETLDPIRALLEHHEIPLIRTLDRDKTPPLHRIREIARFLALLKSRREEFFSSSDLQVLLADLSGAGSENPWYELLRDLLAAWSEETADAALPGAQAIETIYEALAEQKREQAIGHGVFLGTVHGAKGMEFDHVFMPDGGWLPRKNAAQMEEERRVFYVGMTRAREGLCLFQRRDAHNPHLKLLSGNFLLRRPAAGTGDGSVEPADTLQELTSSRYELLGMQDMFLSYAANWLAAMPIHQRLAALQPGSLLSAREARGGIELRDGGGHAVARLSEAAARVWLPRLARIRSVRVVAMIGRNRKDSEDAHRQSCRCENWEVPWVEVVFR
jgi:ATP-dependent DNA helicase RecQ